MARISSKYQTKGENSIYMNMVVFNKADPIPIESFYENLVDIVMIWNEDIRKCLKSTELLRK